MSHAIQTIDSRSSINFILNDKQLELNAFAPDALLLDYIRDQRRLTGTKEGCAEGDCGACTVLVGRLSQGRLEYKSANACIQFLGGLDAKHIVTIEALAGGALKPLQDAMVKYHGSQCGFCTPGIMISLFALFMENAHPKAEEVETALQGNLCRCTGYEPIVKAALSLIGDETCSGWLNQQRTSICEKLKSLSNDTTIEIGESDKRALVPKTSQGLAECLQQNQNATVIAGATDVGLWVTKQFRDINPAIFIGDIQELETIVHENGLTIGANVTYSKALENLSIYQSEFKSLIQRIGGAQVRNAGTIGGNIANGSPIGDMPPALIALSASLTLRSVNDVRQIRLEDFFIEYGEQDLAPDEFVESVHLPELLPIQKIKFYKVSKRRDEDISSVMSAFNFQLNDGIIEKACIALGGMAGIPKRAEHSERFLVGKQLNEVNMSDAAQILSEDFSPLSDWRASADYRMTVAQNLFLKCAIDLENEAVSDAA